MTKLPLPAPQGSPYTPEQERYLSGFVAGLQARGIQFSDLEPLPSQSGPLADEDPLIFEERVKKEEHPLDSTYRLYERARANEAPDKEDTFRFKWNGLFYLNPVKDSYMARLRIPGGQLRSFQLRELAEIAQSLTTGYIQITTRANLQIRLIQPKDAPEFLRRIQAIGLQTRGAGADNIRNLTCNPTAGIDPDELIDTLPLTQELGQFILSHREFYNLPRKFNIALDGGGLIGAVEDTNDLGFKAVKIDHSEPGLEPGIYFRVKAGGATGHKAFANDLGVLISPEKVVAVALALTRVYIAKGNRTDRKKARLKHLLEKISLSDYVAEAEKLLGYPLLKSPAQASPSETPPPHTHVGSYPQKQSGLYYLGVAIPVGQITPKQLNQLAEIADNYGSGEVRLTVWQNLIIPNLPEAFVETVKKRLVSIGLHWKQSNLSSGFIACTGNRYCKFSQADTKGHALTLIKSLEKKFSLDQPINVHITGCPNSCAQHYMGDIGLLGTKTKDGREAFHLLVGGGFGSNQALGRQIFSSVLAEELPAQMEKILVAYQQHRNPGETFQSFTIRHELGKLQELFG